MLLYTIIAMLCALSTGIFASFTVGRQLNIPDLGAIIAVIVMGAFILLAMGNDK